MEKSERIEKRNQLAREVLILSRNTLLVNLRFLDMALSQLEFFPVEESSLLTDGRYILYNPQYILENYKAAKEIPVRDYLHMVMHCVFRHMYMDPTLDQAYWDLACDIAVENVITELGLKAVAAGRERQQSQYIAAIKKELKHITAEKIYSYLRQTVPNHKKIAQIRGLFYGDNHEIWYMTGQKAAEKYGLPQDGNGEGEGQSRVAMAQVWADISQRMQTDLETFGKQRGLLPGAMTQNLAAVNREKYDYTAFLKKFAVLGEAMKINDDEFDYIFYTYGLKLYEKMPLIEPLEYKEVKAIDELADISYAQAFEKLQLFLTKLLDGFNITEKVILDFVDDFVSSLPIDIAFFLPLSGWKGTFASKTGCEV